ARPVGRVARQGIPEVGITTSPCGAALSTECHALVHGVAPTCSDLIATARQFESLQASLETRRNGCALVNLVIRSAHAPPFARITGRSKNTIIASDSPQAAREL